MGGPYPEDFGDQLLTPSPLFFAVDTYAEIARKRGATNEIVCHFCVGWCQETRARLPACFFFTYKKQNFISINSPNATNNPPYYSEQANIIALPGICFLL